MTKAIDTRHRKCIYGEHTSSHFSDTSDDVTYMKYVLNLDWYKMLADTFRHSGKKHHHPEVQQQSRTHTLLEMHLNKLYNFEVLLI